MKTAKIAITIDRNLLQRLDELVGERRFPSRSRAIQQAIQDKIDRLDKTRLARECAKLDANYENDWPRKGCRKPISLPLGVESVDKQAR